MLQGKRLFTCYGGYQNGKSSVTMFRPYDFVISRLTPAVRSRKAEERRQGFFRRRQFSRRPAELPERVHLKDLSRRRGDQFGGEQEFA